MRRRPADRADRDPAAPLFRVPTRDLDALAPSGVLVADVSGLGPVLNELPATAVVATSAQARVEAIDGLPGVHLDPGPSRSAAS
jgi:hypothetical protein